LEEFRGCGWLDLSLCNDTTLSRFELKLDVEAVSGLDFDISDADTREVSHRALVSQSLDDLFLEL
jgi:hypothetical protein